MNYRCVRFWRSLCFASVALLAGCSYGNVGTVTAPTTTVATAHAPSCRSNADCGAGHTGGLCVAKPVTKELSHADDFLERAMSLHNLITSLGDSSSSSQMMTIQQQVRADLSTYSQIASGRVPSSANDTRTQVQQMQDAAWMQSGATQAYVIIRQFSSALSTVPITTDAQTVYTDIAGDNTGLHLDKVISDLQTFLKDIDVVVAPNNELVGYREPDGSAPGPKTGAGALMRYLGPVLAAINEATSSVNAFLDPSAIPQLQNELTVLSQAHDLVGKDGNAGTCLGSR
jgi:hypothetical protein